MPANLRKKGPIMVAFNSIYTNPAAYTALQSLNKVNRNLDIAQNRVASGLRVANAMDSASTYQIANGLRGEVKAIESVQASIAKFKGIVDYTLAAAEAISDLTSSLRAKFQEQADSTITTAQRNVISEEIFELISQARGFAKQAANNDTVNGSLVDLFSVGAGGADISVQTGILGGARSIAAAGNTITVTKADTAAIFTHLNSFATKAAATGTTAAANSVLTNNFALYETAMANALGKLQARSSELQRNQDLLTVFKGTREEVIGSYVDADLATESARLTALQVQQQLAVQALGIANQRPQSLLGLFR